MLQCSKQDYDVIQSIGDLEAFTFVEGERGGVRIRVNDGSTDASRSNVVTFLSPLNVLSKSTPGWISFRFSVSFSAYERIRSLSSGCDEMCGIKRFNVGGNPIK